MENASNAMLLAAGVLIGILILSLAVFLFADFSRSSRETAEAIHENQLTQFNTQFTIYQGREDITIYDIITIANYAKDHNIEYSEYTNFENEHKITVKIQKINQDINEMTKEEYDKLISDYTEVYRDGDIGLEDEDRGELKTYFKAVDVNYHNNGRVSEINFIEIKK